MQSMKVLGIETSCDETGVAVYDSGAGLLGHALYSQTKTHAEYGGVVPELASRDHVRKLAPMVQTLLRDLALRPADIDGVAYTAGPGLIGALLVGASFARSLAYAWGKPAIEVHHLEGHLLAPLLEDPAPQWPLIALLVSGGHTQLFRVNAPGDYQLLGESLDDAAGEAFDKTAKLLGLGYPGGPALARLADQGDPLRFDCPRPMTDRPGLDFSFSGLKTHVLNLVRSRRDADGCLDPRDQADIAAAFQLAVVDTLLIKCRRALKQTGLRRLVVAGGVGANRLLRERLSTELVKRGGSVFYPRIEFCTDNGAMIALAGCLRLQAGAQAPLALQVHPRWPLADYASTSAS